MRFAELASRALCVLCLALLLAAPAGAGPREQARRLHDRLAGVPPSAAVLDQMAALIATGNPADTLAAANIAMQNPQFLMTSVKNMATPWTNVERSVHGDLNDYTALVIGMIRDDVPFNQVLTADLMYVGANVQPAYSQTDNEHYRALESQRVDLSNPTLFVPVLAVDPARLAAHGRRHGRRDHHARRGRSLLQRRHQPPHVALHDAQLSVPRHGAAARHHAAGGPHPPGREPQPRRRQPPVPQRL